MDRAQTIAGEQISRRIREEERHDGEIRGQATALGQKWLSREGDNDAYAGRSSWTNFYKVIRHSQERIFYILAVKNAAGARRQPC